MTGHKGKSMSSTNTSTPKMFTPPLPEGTHTVVLGIGDLNGIMRGKRIPADQWNTVCKNGNAISMAIFSMDMTCDVWETPYVNFANGYPDMHIFPLYTPVAVPWEPGVAFCFAYAEGADHQHVPIDPRNALIQQVERANRLGLDIQVGTEVEFYLIDHETKKSKEKGIQVYSLLRAAQNENVLGPIRRHLNAMGIPIEQSNPEYAPGQAEVNIRYSDALSSADRLIMFRELVRELAHQHGYIATFMAKPYIEESGNGFHAHYSVWRNGNNIFSNAGKLSKEGLAFLAGIQQRMTEYTIVGSTTPNAYRRRKPYTFCPTHTHWGFDNRTCALRVIEGADHAVRIEKRDASADCNPYLLLACDIAAGLDGLESNLQPTPPCHGDGYASDINGVIELPKSLNIAIETAENSIFLKSVLQQDNLTILIQQAKRELNFFENQVTPVELHRYLGNF